MTLNEFCKSVDELVLYYERKGKPPSDGTLDAWHEKVKHIPSEALPWIVRRIEEEHESWPRNIPMAIRQHADEWWQSHPEKHAPERWVECPDCEQGLIYVRKQVQVSAAVTPSVCQYVFRCGRCQQSRVEAYPMAKQGELLAQGYTLTPVWEAMQVPAYQQPRARVTYEPQGVPEAEDREAWRLRLAEQAREIRAGAR